MQLTTSEVLNDLSGYVVLRHVSRPNLPVLGLTCDDGRIIGFDLFTPPFDEQVRQLREEVSTTMDLAVQIQQQAAARLSEKGLSPAEAESIRKTSAARLSEVADELTARIHTLAVADRFRLVTVDHGWAAQPMRQRRVAQVRRFRLMYEAGIRSPERLEELLRGTSAPTPLEEKNLEGIRRHSRQFDENLHLELTAVMKVKLLRSFLEASPLFEKRDIAPVQPDGSKPDLSQFGVTVFIVREKSEKESTE